ncbi:MAG: peptidylprolyl isomerase, partial [Planctomycetota bacterium]
EAEIAERLEYHYGPSVQVRQIVVKTAETARQIQEQALRNPEGFDRLAKKFSIDQNTNGMGGLLLPVRRNSGMPEFENLAFSLQPGQVSEVLPLADVFIVLKCEKHFPAEPLPPQNFVAEKQRIVEELSKSKLRSAALNLFEQMQSTAKIVNVMNDPELGRQMPGVAAQVNGRNIMLNHVAEDCISHYGAQILESEITRQILLDALEQSGLQVSQEDINAEIARAAEANFGEINTDEWLKYVTNNDLSKVEFYIEDEVWPTVAMKKLVEKSVDVTQEDMQKGFDANFGEMVEVLAIVTGDQRSALKVWNMASKNPTADFFGKLAKQYSMEPASKNNYGAVPPIRKNGGQPELEKEAFSLQRGELSKVVQVGKHWLILYCLGRTDPVVTDSDAVKEEIYKDILEKKLRLAMANEFQKLREEAQIDNFLAATSQPGKAAIRQARQSQQGRPAPFTSKR